MSYATTWLRVSADLILLRDGNVPLAVDWHFSRAFTLPDYATFSVDRARELFKTGQRISLEEAERLAEARL